MAAHADVSARLGFLGRRLPWIRIPARKTAQDPTARILRRLERQFLYRGASSLETARLNLEGDRVDVAFFARPVFADDRRSRSREEAFALQLFRDTVTIAETILASAPGIQEVTLTALVKTADGRSVDVPLLSAGLRREHAERLLGPGLPAFEVLRAIGARSRLDRRGNLRDPAPL